MPSAPPNFRRFSNGPLQFGYTDEARRISKANVGIRPTCLAADVVQRNAVSAVKEKNGDVTDALLVLGEHVLQFGAYYGQTFRWMCENGLGYAAWIVDSMRAEVSTSASLSMNKFAFKRYLLSFPEGVEAVNRKVKEREVSLTSSSSLSTLLVGRQVSKSALRGKVHQALQHSTRPILTVPRPATQRRERPKFAAATATATSSPRTTTKEDMTDKELCSAVEYLESRLELQDSPSKLPARPLSTSTPSPTPSKLTARQPSKTPPSTPSKSTPSTSTPSPSTSTPSPSTSKSSTSKSSVCHPHVGDVLPEGWKQSLRPADHHWVAKTMFHLNRSGRVELNASRLDRLWWYPPQPSLIYNHCPRANLYFAQRLLLWMPKRLWRCRLTCPHSSCDDHELTSAGIYPHVRQVLDIDSYYSLAAEYLECSSCKRKVISWSRGIVSQLDLGHQVQFTVILTYRYACDIRVIRMLRQRGLGNSPTQLQKKISEQHGDVWLQKVVHYLTDCKAFKLAATSGLTKPVKYQDPPQLATVPMFRWLMTVYCHDVMQRLDEVKASITSTFGRILKMDSTKKVTKKLSGLSFGTASWATNVGNEHGQVLMSVITASEGAGLGRMISGLVSRYSKAGIPPPHLIYVDRDCCTKTKSMFAGWPDMIVRLDVWHFMRRISSGCCTEAHQLYRLFMARLSQCIFQWDEEDVERLKNAKRRELTASNILNLSDDDVIARVTRKELALHCRRSTRGTRESRDLIAALLDTFDDENGMDTMGVPLIDKERMAEVWTGQERHVTCLQDPVDVQLYTQTGSLTKGGVELPVYRCARGSTSLESFHLHLNRFIPGNSASDVNFQAFLVEGIARWNKDRAVAAVDGGVQEHRSYSAILRHAVNDLSASVLGKQLTRLAEPRKFTGELIGVEYLYDQTGQVLQDWKEEDDDDTFQAEVEGMEADEGYVDADADDDLTVALYAPVARRQASSVRPPSTPTPRASTPTPRTSTPTPRTSTPTPRRSATVTLPFTSPSATVTGSSPSTSDTSTPEKDELDLDDTVGEDNVGGYGRVDSLAQFLVSLRDQLTPISNSQADSIVSLWKGLSLYDQQPTRFAPRYRTSLSQGRFKVSKKAVAPGVQSSKRCFLGESAGPAQWPDCNRYVERVITKLCDTYPLPTCTGGVRVLRWTLVGRAYKRIRQLVLTNAVVMAKTTIQLVEINNTTLTQWYNKKMKRQDRVVLEQGIAPSTASMTAPAPLPPAMMRTTQPLYPAPPEEIHSYTLPPNTAGTAKTGRSKKSPSPAMRFPVILPMPTMPISSMSSSMFMMPAPRLPVPQSLSERSVPYTTQQYRKRREKLELAGTKTRRYEKKTDFMTCKKCGKERTAASHRQYYGTWFCAATATETEDDWLSSQKSKRKKKE